MGAADFAGEIPLILKLKPTRDAGVLREIVAIVKLPDVRKRFDSEGGVPVGNSSQEFAVWLKAEIAKWAKVVKAANITLE